MTNIDFQQVVTSEAKAADKAAARAQAIKSECAARITAIVNERALLNIQGAAIAGALTDKQVKAFEAARRWIAGMQAECRSAIAGGAAPDWPKPPASVRALAADF